MVYVKDDAPELKITNEDFRKRVGELASRANEHGDCYDIGTNPKRPSYRLEPAALTPPATLATAIPVRPDQVRKKLNIIRALLRVEDDFCFGILVGERIVAVLRRHPNLDITDVHEFRKQRTRLEHQLSEQREEHVKPYEALAERLRRIEAIVQEAPGAIKKPRSRGRKQVNVKPTKSPRARPIRHM